MLINKGESIRDHLFKNSQTQKKKDTLRYLSEQVSKFGEGIYANM